MGVAEEGLHLAQPLLLRSATPKVEEWLEKAGSVRQLPEFEDGELERRLGPIELTLLGIGACIGAGIFVLTGAEAHVAGPSVALSFLLAAASSIFNGLCYAELASRLPISGSAYLYAYCTFGELTALILVINQLIDYHLGAATLARSLVAYVAQGFEEAGVPVHECVVGCQPFESAPWFSLSLGAPVVLALLTVVVARGAETNAMVTSVVTVLKLGIVVFVISIGIGRVDTERWQPFFPNGFAATMQSAATLNYAFIGYDVIASAAEECEKPQRDIPAAMIASLLACAVLYFSLCLVLCGMQSFSSIDTEAPVSVAFTKQGQLWVASVVDVGSFAGMASGLLAGLYGQSRTYFAMARDRMAPRTLQSPPHCAAWCGGIAAVLSTFLNVRSLASFLNIGVLLSYAVTAGSVLVVNTCTRRSECSLLAWVAALAGLLAVGAAYSTPLVVAAAAALLLTCAVAHTCRTYACCPGGAFRCPGMPTLPLVALATNVYLAAQLSRNAWLRLIVVTLFVVVCHSVAVCTGTIDRRERQRHVCKTVKAAAATSGTNPGLCGCAASEQVTQRL